MRGVYPADDFKMTDKYGLKILMNKDEKIIQYLDGVMSQLRGAGLWTVPVPTRLAAAVAALSRSRHPCSPRPLRVCVAPPVWIMKRVVQKLVLVIKATDTSETLERWQFDLQVEGPLADDG